MTSSQKPSSDILLGFEVGTGAPVSIPLRHMCITGQTQESGKTTTLEALISRSGLKALAFITKRGEASFEEGRKIAPFFQERADWEFVESVMEATMKQKMKFERAWTVKACRGALTLADVQRNVARLQATSKRSMDQDLFMLLGEYLSKVVPLVERLPRVHDLDLQPGLNVMDLREYPEELQMLVVASSIAHIHKTGFQIVTIVPEAWKFIPQGRNSPVKVEVRKLVREGAALRNYIWIDSQDIAGVEKEILRGCSVWLLGVQREANEIERTLANIPKGVKRPSEGDIPRLALGQFYACFADQVRKTYVWPTWLIEQNAVAAARGLMNPNPRPNRKEPEVDYKTLYEQEKSRADDLERRLTKLEDERKGQIQAAQRTSERIREERPRLIVTPPETITHKALPESFDQFYDLFKKRLLDDIQRETGQTGLAGLTVALAHSVPEIEVTVQREKITYTTETAIGRVIYLIADGFVDTGKYPNEMEEELLTRGLPTGLPNIRECLPRLIEKGFLRKQTNGRYQSVAGMKRNIIEEK